MNWLEIEDIAELLEETYPDEDIMRLRFTKLQQMVMNLEEFDGEAGKCNEKILQAIQGKWHEIRNS